MAATLEDLFAHVTDLQNSKAQLLLQIQGLDNALARARVSIAEVQNINRHSRTSHLPHELLSSIFEAGLSLPPTSYVGEKPFEILVSHVSRRWRIVASQTPRLWTEIYVNIWGSAVELLDLYLERSGECLLDIRFEQIVAEGGDPHPEFESNNFDLHLNRLVPYAARWRQLSIHAFFSRPLDMVLSPLTNIYAPALESISLGAPHVHVFDSHDSPTCINLFCGGAPILSSVELYEKYTQAVRPPLGGVTSLTLGGNSYDLTLETARGLFRPMSFLTRLVVQGDIILPLSDRQLIELPSVRTFHLYLNPNDRIRILRCLHLPAVEELTIENFSEDIFDCPELQRTIFPALRSLNLRSHRMSATAKSPGSIIAFIAAFSTIEEVAFDDTYPTAFLEVLSNHESTEAPPWPELRSMIVVSSSTSYWKAVTILSQITKIIENRMGSGRPISYVKLSSEITKHSQQNQLQRIREQVVMEEC